MQHTRTRLCLLGWLLLALVARGHAAGHDWLAPGEEQDRSRWVNDHLLASDPRLPFSFIYGGQASGELLPGWRKGRDTRKPDANRTRHTLVWTEAKSGLEVRCVAVEYADYPAVEWVLHFTNTGKEDSGIIERIEALDNLLPWGGNGFVLHRALGDSNSAESFAPVDEPLPAGDLRERVFAPNGGRSSDGNMPYFNIDRHGGGVVLAIGWSGQWEAGFQPLADGRLRVRAGQQRTHFKLHPGETVRSPRIVLVFWQGPDDLRGNNVFRQLALAHYLPRHDGKPVFPPVCATVGRPAADEDAWVPPVNNVHQRERVLSFFSDMPTHATVAVGGHRQGDKGFYVEPTVLLTGTGTFRSLKNLKSGLLFGNRLYTTVNFSS